MLHLNILDGIFLQFTFFIVIVGGLVNVLEPYLPVCIRQSFRYGKHAYEGVTCKWVSWLEMPKSNFKHFYISSTTWSLFSVCLAMYVYYFNGITPEWFIKFLNFWCGENRISTVSSTSTFFALSLLYLQCLRRLYETHCVQVFSPSSKMNLSHYIVGHFHYFGAVIAILSQAKGFTKYDFEHITTSNLNEVSYNLVVSAIFLFAWLNQFRANIILANLRKDKKNGSVVSHKHLVPSGGWFDIVSSPHMLCEVLMYLSLGAILYKNTSWWFVMSWVLFNQTECAILAHKWYHTSFPNYPKSRKAIFPYLF